MNFGIMSQCRSELGRLCPDVMGGLMTRSGRGFSPAMPMVPALSPPAIVKKEGAEPGPRDSPRQLQESASKSTFHPASATAEARARTRTVFRGGEEALHRLMNFGSSAKCVCRLRDPFCATLPFLTSSLLSTRQVWRRRGALPDGPI